MNRQILAVLDVSSTIERLLSIPTVKNQLNPAALECLVAHIVLKNSVQPTFQKINAHERSIVKRLIRQIQFHRTLVKTFFDKRRCVIIQNSFSTE